VSGSTWKCFNAVSVLCVGTSVCAVSVLGKSLYVGQLSPHSHNPLRVMPSCLTQPQGSLQHLHHAHAIENLQLFCSPAKIYRCIQCKTL